MHSSTKELDKLRRDARKIFRDSLTAVDPEVAVGRHCRVAGNRLMVGDRAYDLSAFRRLTVLGAGKASAVMAGTLEKMLGNRIDGGCVVVKYAHTVPLDRIRIVEAGHPVPDRKGLDGAAAIFDLARSAQAHDLILCAISGGGSALLPLPQNGLTLQDKQATVSVLLSCGASIHEINAIRKHISKIKGGRLAEAAWPATVVSLLLSDVVGDDPDVIASGLTVADTSTFEDCLAVCRKYHIQDRLPASVVDYLTAGAAGRHAETPKTGHPVFSRTQNRIVGNNMAAILAAKQTAEALGYRTLVLSSMIEGETRHVAGVHGAIAREIVKTGHPITRPACILSGGETTVTLSGAGRGGRNQEFALAAALAISGDDETVILSAGTDGTDGPTDAAGAIVDNRTIRRAERAGLDPQAFLAANDAYHFFAPLDDLLITGPTGTNVMDLRIVLVA